MDIQSIIVPTPNLSLSVISTLTEHLRPRMGSTGVEPPTTLHYKGLGPYSQHFIFFVTYECFQ